MSASPLELNFHPQMDKRLKKPLTSVWKTLLCLHHSKKMKVVVFYFFLMIQRGAKIAGKHSNWCNVTGGNFFCKMMSFCGILSSYLYHHFSKRKWNAICPFTAHTPLLNPSQHKPNLRVNTYSIQNIKHHKCWWQKECKFGPNTQ